MVKLTELYILKEDRETIEALLCSSQFQSIVEQHGRDVLDDRDVEDWLPLVAIASVMFPKWRWIDDDSEDQELIQYLSDQLQASSTVGDVARDLFTLQSRKLREPKMDVLVYQIALAIGDGHEDQAEQLGEQLVGVIRKRIKTSEKRTPNYNSSKFDVLDVGNGYVWRRVCGEENFGIEAAGMSHCGGGEGATYSLRDKRGKPRVTADVKGNVLSQLRGSVNRPPEDEYLPACKKLVRYLGINRFTDDYNNDGMTLYIKKELGLLDRSVIPSEKDGDILSVNYRLPDHSL